MKEKLKNIATVQLGYSFRAKLEPTQGAGISVIQMKDLTENNTLNSDEITTIDMGALKEKHRVRVNDIAFRSRGLASTAALINKQIENAVIAAPLFHIRVNESKELDPAYLCWFINQPTSQSFLLSKSTGTAQKSIRKASLENLEINIPPIKIQLKIVNLERLAVAEENILTTLAGKKRQLMEGILMRLALETQ